MFALFDNHLNAKWVHFVSTFALHLILDGTQMVCTELGIIWPYMSCGKMEKFLLDSYRFISHPHCIQFLPVWTKFVGLPIIERSIRIRWWRRCLRRVGLCGWWKQHENHCTQISPVFAILLLFIQISREIERPPNVIETAIKEGKIYLDIFCSFIGFIL